MQTAVAGSAGRVELVRDGIGRPRRVPRAPGARADAARESEAVIRDASGFDVLPSIEALAIDWSCCGPQNWYARWGKRLGSIVLLVLTLPAALLIGALVGAGNWVVFRDWRKILFVQKRVGFHGRVFDMYKFRTMRDLTGVDAGSLHGAADHLRVTKFGSLLRKTHLDELPQIINVLRGQMCFIGPRPEMLSIEDWAVECIPGFWRRHAIAPGITGFAQVTEGYAPVQENAYRAKLVADDLYRKRISPFFDVVILMRTVVWMMAGRGWKWREQGARAKASPVRTSIVLTSGSDRPRSGKSVPVMTH